MLNVIRRYLVGLAVLAAVSAAAHNAAAVADWNQNVNANGFKLTGLPAPATATEPLRLQDVAVGACIPKSSATNGTFSCATANVDYVTPSFSLGGDLSGTPTSANVIGLRETGGPTHLTIGAIPNGALTKRSGTTFVGATAGSDFENPLTVVAPIHRAANALSLDANGITDAFIRQGAGTSVIGVAGNSTANVADIPASGGLQFLGTNSGGTALSFQALTPGAIGGLFSSSIPSGPSAVGSVGAASTTLRSDGTRPAYRSDTLATTWFVDPTNGSDAASNNCTTAATACATLQEIKRRWWGAEIQSTTTVTIVDNVPSTDVGTWNFTIKPGVTVTFQGVLGATTGFGARSIDNTLYTGTVTSFVAAANTPAADDIQLGDTGIPTSFTASGLLAGGVLFQRTNSTARYWWAAKDLGSKTLRISPPLTSAVSDGMNASLSVSDTYKAFALKTMPLQDFGAAANGAVANGTIRILFLRDNKTFNPAFHAGGYSVRRDRSWINPLGVEILGPTWANLGIDINSSGVSILTMSPSPPQWSGGLVRGGGSDLVNITGTMGIGGPIVFQGAGLVLLDGAYCTQEATIAVHDVTATALSVQGAAAWIAQSFATPTIGVSGKGNSGKLLTEFNGGRFIYGTQSTSPPFVAGSSSDGNPIAIGSTNYTVAQLPATTEVDVSPRKPFPVYGYDTASATHLTWGAVADGQLVGRSGGSLIGLSTVPASLAATQVGFGSPSNTLTGDSAFFWNSTNKTLVVGDTNDPATSLVVARFARNQAGPLQLALANSNTTATNAVARISITAGSIDASSGPFLHLGTSGPSNTSTGVSEANAAYIFRNSLDKDGNLWIANVRNGAGNDIVLAVQGAGSVEGLRITNAGNVRVASLNTGGYVRAALTTGQLSAVSTIPYTDITGGPAAITALTGDVVATGPGAVAATIASNSVTNAKLADVATQTFKGRTTAGTGDPEDLTATQATAMLNDFTSSLKGLTPASGGGTSTFLRADGTWAAPLGSGGTVTNVTATLPLTSSGGAAPNIALNYDNATVTMSAGNNLQRGPLTGDITASAGSNVTTLASVGGGAGSCTYCSVTFDAKGRQTAYSSGVTPEVPLTFSNGARRTVNNVTVDLTTGVAGGQSVIGGTGAGDPLTLTSTTNGAKGPIRFGGSSNFWDEVLAGFSLGGGTLASGEAMRVSGKRIRVTGTNSGNLIAIENTNNGATAYSEIGLINDLGDTLRGSLYYTSSTYAGSDSAPSSLTLATSAGSSSKIIFSPNNNRALEVTPTSVKVNSLAGTGTRIVSTSSTGVLGVATALEIAAAQTWPAAGRVLVSSGTTTAPTSDANFTYDVSTHTAALGTSVGINGVGMPSNAALVVGHTTDANRDHMQFFLGGGSSEDNPDNSLFEVFTASTTIPAGRTTGVWAAARIDQWALTGVSSPAITEATTLYLPGAPTVTSATATKYVIHAPAGAVAFGDLGSGGGSTRLVSADTSTGRLRTAPAPMTMIFTYGGSSYDVALPSGSLGHAPDFWLRPMTYTPSSGAEGFAANGQVWEYPSPDSYTQAELFIRVYQCGITTTAGDGDLTYVVTINGVDTGLSITDECPDPGGGTIDTSFDDSDSVTVSPGDRVGVRAHVTGGGAYSSGALRATVTLRLR